MFKRIIVMTLVLLLGGCNNATGTQTLKEYQAEFSDENRENISIYYDYDGIFDEFTSKDLLKLTLEYKELDDSDKKLDNFDIKEVEEKVSEFELGIIKKFEFVFDTNYEKTDDSIDEGDIRIIIENNDTKINIYEGGYVKLFKDDEVTCYKSSDNKFNDNIDNFYKHIASMNEYTLEVIKDLND